MYRTKDIGIFVVYYDVRHAEQCVRNFKLQWEGSHTGLLPVSASFATAGYLSSIVKNDPEEMHSVLENDGTVYVQENSSAALKIQVRFGSRSVASKDLCRHFCFVVLFFVSTSRFWGSLARSSRS